MIAASRSERAMAVALSLLAGFVDAIGFIASGGYFLSFMSGNSTRLAVAGVAGQAGALVAGGLIALFLLGVIGGSLLARWRPAARQQLVLAGLALLLAAAAALGHLGWRWPPLALLALAMGLENIYFAEAGAVRLGLTYMTGRLVALGQALAAALVGEDRTRWRPHLLLWLGLVGGGALGALAYRLWGLDALWLGALWAVAAMAAPRERADAPA